VPLKESRTEREESATAYSRLSGPAYHGGFVARYDALRVRPPSDLIELLSGLAPTHPPQLVVDLGCGTGISTVAWSEFAARTIGIDRNPEMLAAARSAPNVEYRRAEADATGLQAACADIVTCAQSLHWMDPRRTLSEVARVLRPGGVFAAYDYDWPPLVQWEIEAAFLAVIEASGVDPARPEKARHVERLQASGHFRSVREVFVHAREHGDAQRLTLLPLVFGPIARRLHEGASAADLGLDRYRNVVERRVGADGVPLWWSYRVRLAVK
jgi:ubiquinone/menaquinone biosynthesis C-methylase UbiE